MTILQAYPARKDVTGSQASGLELTGRSAWQGTCRARFSASILGVRGMQRGESDHEALELPELEALEPLDSPSLKGQRSGSLFEQPDAEVLPESGFELSTQGRATPAELRPSSGSLVMKRSMERQRSQGVPTELAEQGGSGSGGPQKAKERNRRAQQTFRQRQKVCRQLLQGKLGSAFDSTD